MTPENGALEEKSSVSVCFQRSLWVTKATEWQEMQGTVSSACSMVGAAQAAPRGQTKRWAPSGNTSGRPRCWAGWRGEARWPTHVRTGSVLTQGWTPNLQTPERVVQKWKQVCHSRRDHTYSFEKDSKIFSKQHHIEIREHCASVQAKLIF